MKGKGILMTIGQINKRKRRNILERRRGLRERKE
jgi:hypothetical protein